jgi:sulfotransferase family protein
MNTNVSTPTIQPDQGILDPLTMRARTVAHMGTIEKLYRGITSSIRVLPDFLIIGTQRGGTTALYHYLKTHPCIIPATIGDTHFFDKKYSKGLRWYQAHFPTLWEKAYAQQVRKRPLVTGEASSSYLFYPLAPKRVAEVLPHVKLIVLLRNPVDRAYSQYYHAVELKHETLPFEEAVQDEEKRTAQEREKILQDEQYESHTYTHRSYLTRGIYVDQLQAWMTLFPREQFLILKSEEFYTDPVATFTQVSAFLNLPAAKPRLNKKNYTQYSHNTYFATMDPVMRTRLIEYFKPHNARLYEYLGIDFGWDK